jgi:hypothetical protein
MTAKERDILEQLRSSVQEYHGVVCAHMARCESCNKQVNQHTVDLYGNPDDRSGIPGVISQIADLRKSRKILMGVAAGAWTIVTIFAGAIASRLI